MRAGKNQILLILFLGFTVLAIQMAAIRRPWIGHYGSYQMVMASMARNMLRENFSELHLPKTDFLVGDKRSLHLNQYPFCSVAAALGERIFGGGLEFWGRFQAVIFHLLSGILLGLIAAKLFDPLTGWISVILYAFSPFTLIYGQSFMSEASSLFFMLLALGLILPPADFNPLTPPSPPKGERVKGEGENVLRIILSGLAFSMVLASRIHWIVFFPLFWFLLFTRGKDKPKELIAFSTVSLVLPAVWSFYTYFLTLHADHVHTNLLMQLTTRGRTDFGWLENIGYYQKIFDTVSGPLLTPLAFPFFFLGLVLADKKKLGFGITAMGILGGILLVALVPDKVMKHDFYLYGCYPFLAFLAASGIAPLLRTFPRLTSGPVLTFLLIVYLGVSSRYFLHPIFKSSSQEKELVRVAELVKGKMGPEDRLMVLGEGAGIFIYYADRPGWTVDLNQIGKGLSPYRKGGGLNPKQIGEMHRLEAAGGNAVALFRYFSKQGATFLVAPDKKELQKEPNLLNYLLHRHELLSQEGDSFYLFRIRSPS